MFIKFATKQYFFVLEFAHLSKPDNIPAVADRCDIREVEIRTVT